MRIEHSAFDVNSAALEATLPVPLGYVPGSRKAEEEAALRQLLIEIPESARPTTLQALDPHSKIRVAQITNPRLAAHTILSPLSAASTLQHENLSGREVLREPIPLTVTIALVDPVMLGTARARIVRDPYGGISDLILLWSGDASVDDLAAGIGLMYRSRLVFGDYLRNVVRADVVSFGGPSTGSARAQAQSVLALVSAKQPGSLHAFGTARQLTLHLGPISSL